MERESKLLRADEIEGIQEKFKPLGFELEHVIREQQAVLKLLMRNDKKQIFGGWVVTLWVSKDEFSVCYQRGQTFWYPFFQQTHEGLDEIWRLMDNCKQLSDEIFRPVGLSAHA